MPHFEPQYPLHGVDDDGGYTEMMAFIHGHEGPGARVIGDWLMEKLKPASVIDLGCGPGVYLIPFMDAGAEVLGVDACPASGADLPEGAFVRWDLRYPYCPPHRFDLALFCEVGEHLERHWSERLVDTCFDCSDVLLVTWAVPGQGGHRHVNEQSYEWVLSIFRERHGYAMHPLHDEWRAFVESLPDAAEGMHPPADAPAGVPGWLKRNSFLLWRSPELRDAEPWSEPPWPNAPQTWLGGKTWRELGYDPVGRGASLEPKPKLRTMRYQRDGREVLSYAFWCPGCLEPHRYDVEGGEFSWEFNGDLLTPTFKPSLRITSSVNCHLFMTDGRIQYLDDCSHDLAGQTIDLPEWPTEPVVSKREALGNAAWAEVVEKRKAQKPKGTA